MEQFKEWEENTELLFFNEVQKFILGIKNNVIRNISIGNNYINFKFPQYDQLIRSPIPTNSYVQNRPTAMIAASRMVLGRILKEGGIENKGVSALNVVNRIIPNTIPGREQNLFKNAINNKLGKVASTLGLLFEIEVFLHLHDGHHLDDEDNIVFNLYSQRENFTNIIKDNVGKVTVGSILKFIQIHASQLGDSMVAMTKNKLKCRPKKVKFFGGMLGGAKSIFRDPSDIRISCGGNKSIGYSLKFTSEHKTQIVSTTAIHLIKSMNVFVYGDGDKEAARLNSKLEKTFDPELSKEIILDAIESLAKKFKPHEFTEFLNILINGGFSNVFTAYRNWKTGKGLAGFSPNVSIDFEIEGNKLIQKEDAVLSIRRNNTYVAMSYKSPTGSRHGTQIFLEPSRKEEVVIKVTNLLS